MTIIIYHQVEGDMTYINWAALTFYISFNFSNGTSELYTMAQSAWCQWDAHLQRAELLLAAQPRFVAIQRNAFPKQAMRLPHFPADFVTAVV